MKKRSPRSMMKRGLNEQIAGSGVGKKDETQEAGKDNQQYQMDDKNRKIAHGRRQTIKVLLLLAFVLLLLLIYGLRFMQHRHRRDAAASVKPINP